MNPVKYLKKALVIEMGFAAAPAVAGFGSIIGTSAAAALPVTAAATGLVTTVGAATAATAAATAGGLFGGGSLLSNVAAGASIASRLFQGEAESANLETQAKDEQFNARNRQIERKRNLVRALALQNVRTGASGFTFEKGSSAAAIQFEDIERFELDQSTDALNTANRIDQLKQNASNATKFSLLSAGGEAARFVSRTTARGTV